MSPGACSLRPASHGRPAAACCLARGLPACLPPPVAVPLRRAAISSSQPRSLHLICLFYRRDHSHRTMLTRDGVVRANCSWWAPNAEVKFGRYSTATVADDQHMPY
eukprot:COSAG01_NODE_4007_length_5440_cov_3.804531_6_plen_106_part_00